jgi:hypothetical protein
MLKELKLVGDTHKKKKKKKRDDGWELYINI